MANTDTSRTTCPAATPARRASRPREKGAELIEFTLVLMGLMMLTLGFISFSRAYNVYQSITRAAREGAREAVLPSSVYDGNAYLDNNGTFTTPTSPIFNSYIKPALEAANLNPNACSSSSATGCISNYNEQVGWLVDPGNSWSQCGVSISFVYPYRLSIPFTTVGLTTLQLHTNVRMRLENSIYQQNADGTYSQTCP